MINGFIGILGHKILKKKKNIFLTRSLNYASYLYFTSKKDCFVQKNEDRDFYEIIERSEKYIEDNYVPIYNQILDIEAIELHKITEILKENNGELKYLNTDNAVAKFKNLKDVDNCKKELNINFWDKENKIPKYKIQSEISNIDRMEVRNTDQFVYRPHIYKTINDPGNNDFTKLAQELIDLNSSFQVDGRGYRQKHFIKRNNKKTQRK